MAKGRKTGGGGGPRTLGGTKLTNKQRAFWLMIAFVMLIIYFFLITAAWSR